MSDSANYISDSDIIGDRPLLRCYASVPEFYDNPFSLKIVDANLGPGFLMGRRQSPLPLLMVCYEGCALVRQRADEPGWKLVPGQAVFIPQGESVSYSSHRGSRFGHFGLEWLHPEDAPKSKHEGLRCCPADPQPFRHAYEGLCHEIVNKRQGLVLHDWLQVFDQLARRVVQGSEDASPLAALFAAIERDLQHPWSIQEMALQIGVSESSLRRLFWKEIGESPNQCVKRLRLAKAGALLTSGSTAKLTDIAEQVGYASPYALSKAFSACFGLSPGQYRKRHCAPQRSPSSSKLHCG
ncbi:AraC family transcriptional regulator [Kamptonema cortianum]|nr:AraC family transcriptional regulator [Kamptonema cortianum]